jgi:PKD repeat protein
MQFAFTTTSGATSWVWDFGDGTQSSEATPTHTYTTAGTQAVTLTLLGGCADDMVNATTTVNPLPQAEFTYSPEIPTTRRDIIFTYTGTPVSTYVWNLGGGATSTAAQPSTQYTLEGEQTVFLAVTDANGCTDVTQQTFDVLINPSLFFPNSFAPQGVNQAWHGDGIGIDAVEVVIYTRNGNLIWECSTLEQCLATGWDGTYEGLAVPQGVFAFRATATFYNNTAWDYVGTVTLMR